MIWGVYPDSDIISFYHFIYFCKIIFKNDHGNVYILGVFFCPENNKLELVDVDDIKCSNNVGTHLVYFYLYLYKYENVCVCVCVSVCVFAFFSAIWKPVGIPFGTNVPLDLEMVLKQ